MDEDMPYYQRSSTTLIVQGHGQDYPDDVFFFFDKKLFIHVKLVTQIGTCMVGIFCFWINDDLAMHAA